MEWQSQGNPGFAVPSPTPVPINSIDVACQGSAPTSCYAPTRAMALVSTSAPGGGLKARADSPTTIGPVSSGAVWGPNGRQIKSSFNAMFAPSPTPVSGILDATLEQAGVYSFSGFYWTGTAADGILYGGGSCSDWASISPTTPTAAGQTTVTSTGWVAAVDTNCGNVLPWLCICTAPQPINGGFFYRGAQSSYTGNLGGRSGANAVCQNSYPAQCRGPASNFLAFLGTSSPSKSCATVVQTDLAFPPTKPIWGRTPTVVAVTAAPIFQPAPSPSSTPALTNSLTTALVSKETSTWTGCNYDGTTSGNTCSDWTTASPATSGQAGFAPSSSVRWINDGTQTCNYAFADLICGCLGVIMDPIGLVFTAPNTYNGLLSPSAAPTPTAVPITTMDSVCLGAAPARCPTQSSNTKAMLGGGGQAFATRVASIGLQPTTQIYSDGNSVVGTWNTMITPAPAPTAVLTNSFLTAKVTTSPTAYWTGAGLTCSEWTTASPATSGTVGDPAVVTQSWVTSTSIGCNNFRPVECMCYTGPSRPVMIVYHSGTTGNGAAMGSSAAWDSTCATAAPTSCTTGTPKKLGSTSSKAWRNLIYEAGLDLSDQAFGPTGTFIGTIGQMIRGTTGTALTTSLQTALGIGSVNIWTGSGYIGEYLTNTCSDWTSSSGGVLGVTGASSSTANAWITNANTACSTGSTYYLCFCVGTVPSGYY